MSTNPNRNQWLDLWRAVAVTLVVCCHGFELLRNPSVTRIEGLSGLFGVEIFFCLSGFLIGTIFIKATQNYRGSPGVLLNFMVRRWMRTLPNYYFYLALNFWLFWIGWTTVKIVDIAPYIFFTQNLLRPHPAFFPEAWSLGVEEVFYLLLPIAFFVAWIVTRRPITALVAALIILMMVSVALRYPVIHANLPYDEYVRKISLHRLDSLMWGVALAVLRWHLADHHRRLLRWLSVSMLCFLYFPIVGFSIGISWMPRIALLLMLFPLTSIGICGVLSLGMEIRLPRSVVAITGRLSKWSYSMYLANMPTYYLFINFVEPKIKFSHPWLEFFCDVAVVIGISLLTYTCVEKPFLSLRDKVFPERRISHKFQDDQAPKQPVV